MNNSVFGKMQENLRNRMNVEILTDRKTALKRACKPNMKRSFTIHENLVVMETAITNLELNKPIYVGFSVLELSKLHMYDFHYNCITKWFDKANLCFTDTDSLLYEIEGQNVYNVMREHRDYFDFSGYPFEHELYDKKNKKVIGKFKDELNSLAMEEVVALRPKCYSFLYYGFVEDNIIQNMKRAEKGTAKGTKKSVKKRHLKHLNYKEVLFELKTIFVKQNALWSHEHTVYSFH